MEKPKNRSREISDGFWKMVEPLVPAPKRKSGEKYLRKPGGGRKPVEPRRVFEAIVCALKTGAQWKALPKEEFGSSSSIHRYFQEWSRAGFFKKLWRKGLAEHDEMRGIAWECQSVEGARAGRPRKRLETGRTAAGKGKKRKLSAEEFSWRPVVERRNRCGRNDSTIDGAK